MKLFIYNASLENEKDIAVREKLIEQVKIIDERIKQRTIIFSGLLKGIIISKNKKSSQSEKNKLISGGEQMKYKGITITKHKNCDTWYARYRQNKKQYYVSAKTQIDCYNKLKLAINKKAKEELKPQKVITFIEWYNLWLNTYKVNVTDSTKRDYLYCLNNIQELHKKEINKISCIEIMQTLNKITAERSKQKIYEFLKMLFNKAKIANKIQDNPMQAVDKPNYKRKNGEAFSLEDERTFIKICESNSKYDMFLVALYQGLRHGEVLAITNNDIDFKNKTLTINKSLLINGKFGKTKDESDRTQPIFDKTYNILIKYQNAQGRIFKTDYNTCNKMFNAIRDNYLKNKIYKFKTLRFTFITKCGENNVPEHIIQKWVGHNIGSQVTKQVYTKVREQAEVKNIEKINKLNSN